MINNMLDKIWFPIPCIISTLILLLNTLVLIVRARNGTAFSFLLKNLVSADMLIGIYLLIIVCMDRYYALTFILYFTIWQSGILCFVLAIISYMAVTCSAIFSACIALTRFHYITYNKTRVNFPLRQSVFFALVVWIITGIISITSTLYHISQFQMLPTSTCIILIPLGFTSVSLTAASVITNAVLLMSFIVIIICYMKIFLHSYKTDKEVASFSNTTKRRRPKLYFLLVLLMTIYSCCWLPVVLLSWCSMVGYKVTSSIMIVLVVIFMPLNSIMNPIFYTLGSKEYSLLSMFNVCQR